MIGSGRLEEELKNLVTLDNTNFLENVPHDKLVNLYTQHDIFLLTFIMKKSRLIEAMALA